MQGAGPFITTEDNDIVLISLIDMPPADPATMLTVIIVKAPQISQKVGQDYVIFTCD